MLTRVETDCVLSSVLESALDFLLGNMEEVWAEGVVVYLAFIHVSGCDCQGGNFVVVGIFIVGVILDVGVVIANIAMVKVGRGIISRTKFRAEGTTGRVC